MHAPYFKELLHFIAESKRVIGFDEARKNKE
jgi:hypothetical protein